MEDNYINRNLKQTFISNNVILAQIVLMFLWAGQLLNTDAYYVNYALLVVVASVCTYENIKSNKNILNKYSLRIIQFSSLIFSCMVAFANYRLWAFSSLNVDFELKFKILYSVFLGFVFFVGGYFVFWNIIKAVYANIGFLHWNKKESKQTPINIFIISFVLLILTRVVVLYFCQYPGELSQDSIGQIWYIDTNKYTNHHPFYHTMLIKFLLSLGMRIFGNDINKAVATYSVFQILFTATCFSFTVSTMAQMKVPKWIIVLTMMFYVLMPYHLMYAITMWKDVMFGCFVLLFIVAVYKCMNKIGNEMLNHILLLISGIGTCLFRSNGFFVFVILTVVFVVLWKNNYKKILIIMVVVMCVSLVLKHPVLKKLGVTQPDTIESLSIPAQQIARVIYEGYSLDDWQTKKLEKLVDINRVSEDYNPILSDPIKELVRESGNQHLIVDEKMDYIKLYFSIGLKHPIVYGRAWIDQTRGYWNAGYNFWCWFDFIVQNNYGIERTVRSETLNKLLNEYLSLYTSVRVLRLFLSIGLAIWVNFLMLIIALFRKDKEGIFATLPIIAIAISLLIATPVFSEFRYIYAAFCVLPMVFVIVSRPVNDEIDHDNA